MNHLGSTDGLVRGMAASWKLAVLGLAALALSACASTPPPRAAAPPPKDGVAACLRSLDDRHVQYERAKDFGDPPQSCGIVGAIRVKRDATEWTRATLMSCGLESALDDFEVKVLNPLSRKYFQQDVRKIISMGAYNCRNERSERGDRLSQHAFGKAFDMGGFELTDGTKISILKDWREKGAKSDFLQDVAKGACSYFNVVLTPNYNALHRDHIHVDLGPYKLCGK